MDSAEKEAFLEYLKNRILKIERVIGDIEFFEDKDYNSSQEAKTPDNKANGLNRSPNLSGELAENETKNETKKETENEVEKEVEKLKDLDIYENSTFLDEMRASLQDMPFENINAKKEELLGMMKKHKHRNSFSLHLCVIRYILQQISKDFACDIYNQYNDFYVYIHSSNVVDVFHTLECKKNIILSHIDFMRGYCDKVKQIEKLKGCINSAQITEVDIHLDRLEKIETTNEQLYSQIAEINNTLENVAYKYAIMMQLASKIILKYKQVFS